MVKHRNDKYFSVFLCSLVLSRSPVVQYLIICACEYGSMERLKAVEIVGRCRSKCPVSEMKFREANNLLSIFEISSETTNLRKPKCDPNKCVKEFRRSAAGEIVNKPEFLRPGAVLIETVNYLLQEIVPRKDVSFLHIYDFVFDRLRSVRQDLVIQQIQMSEPTSAAEIFEKCYRFYGYALVMMKQDQSLSIDRHINRIHMLECLNTLLEIYKKEFDAELGVDKLQNSSEFISCYLMCNIGSADAIAFVLSNFSSQIRKTEPLRTAIKIFLSYSQRNYVRIFKHLSILRDRKHYLLLLSFLDTVDKYRTEAVSVLICSHNSKSLTIPADILIKWFLFSRPEEVIELCKKHGLLVTDDKRIRFQKSLFVTPNDMNCMESFMVPPSRAVLFREIFH